MKLGGFLSYAHNDDVNDNGRITRLRERLESSIRVYTGLRDFTIFQDKDGIDWGRDWREVLNQSLDAVVLFFPIMTPLWFASPHCRDELHAFMRRQTALGRNDLVLPIHYVRTMLADQEDPHADNGEAEAGAILRRFQYADWRGNRYVAETDAAYTVAIDHLAERTTLLLRGLRQQLLAPAGPALPPVPTSTQVSTVTPPAAPAVAATTPAGVVLAVDPLGRGDHRTITQALAAAPDGACIRVRPGLYRESVVIDKPIELIGDGDRGDIVVESTAGRTINLTADHAVVRNLTLRQRDAASNCVSTAQGRLILEDCDISSDGLSCVAVSGAADPRVRRNRIHDGKSAGIYVYEGGRGTYEDNDIFANALAGIAVNGQAEPIVRGNHIHDGKQVGIYVHEGGRGIYEDNDIFANSFSGIEVIGQAEPIVRGNRIHNGKAGGIFVHESGRGTYEDNDIFANALAGITVKGRARPIVRGNRIHDGKSVGIFVCESGRGTYEDNDIVANTHRGIEVKGQAEPIVRGNRINRNLYEAIWVYDKAGGTYENNDLRDNKRGPWDIDASSQSLVRRTNNRET